MELDTDLTKSFEIKLYGESQLELAFHGTKSASEWRHVGFVVFDSSLELNVYICSSKALAKWDASLEVKTEQGGLKVYERATRIPKVEAHKVKGDVASFGVNFLGDPAKLLREHLPKLVMNDKLTSELKDFEGIWRSLYASSSTFTLANPVFNAKGDILFELRPRGKQVVAAPLNQARPATLSAGRANSAALPLNTTSPTKSNGNTSSEAAPPANSGNSTNGNVKANGNGVIESNAGAGPESRKAETSAVTPTKSDSTNQVEKSAAVTSTPV